MYISQGIGSGVPFLRQSPTVTVCSPVRMLLDRVGFDFFVLLMDMPAVIRNVWKHFGFLLSLSFLVLIFLQRCEDNIAVAIDFLKFHLGQNLFLQYPSRDKS